MIIISSNYCGPSSDTDKWVADLQANVCLSPASSVSSVCLTLNATSFSESGVNSSIPHITIRRLCQQYHPNRPTATVPPRVTISNLAILSGWFAEMTVSEDRGLSTLLYTFLQLSCLRCPLIQELEKIYILNRRTESSTQMYICLPPVIPIRQNSFLYIHNPAMEVLERDWSVLFAFYLSS